ncbi:hypothetical protein [Flagellimonas onchidii]|uniref:hypothetical protein n=1 Tax=Flagellimonas onchidii TaxID=2562684 RepID=UPI0010A5FE5B|nr:hypothetical protein [Allomuricauda onchidii]
MKKSIKSLILIFGITLTVVSCQKPSIEEIEETNKVLKEDVFKEIAPTGVVTPENLRRPGNNPN